MSDLPSEPSLQQLRHQARDLQRAVRRGDQDALEAGADPNAGYLWHGLPTPFTVLTGVFGEGELGPVRQPRHPHSLALARLLLESRTRPRSPGCGPPIRGWPTPSARRARR